MTDEGLTSIPGIDPAISPSGTGCVECLAGEGPGWWYHLRRCAQCGHIGCCDASPSGHARAHAEHLGHPIVRSFEPGEDWFYFFPDEKFIDGVELTPPNAHPLNQPVPGPAGKVPPDWRLQLR